MKINFFSRVSITFMIVCSPISLTAATGIEGDNSDHDKCVYAQDGDQPVSNKRLDGILKKICKKLPILGPIFFVDCVMEYDQCLADAGETLLGCLDLAQGAYDRCMIEERNKKRRREPFDFQHCKDERQINRESCFEGYSNRHTDCLINFLACSNPIY